MIAVQEIETKNRYKFDADGHVHLLHGKPLMGTSTVVGALGKPLTYWAAGCALTPLGWLNRKKSTKKERIDAARLSLRHISTLEPWGYESLLEQCYHAHTKQKGLAAADGTSTHKALEHYVQHCIDDDGGEPHLGLPEYNIEAVEVFAKWSVGNVKRFIWSEKHCYSEQLWVGGISDCGAVLRNGRRAIIDFKRKGCYYSQFVQVGGYALQAAENGLLDGEGKEFMPSWFADDVIVFPNAGDPRTEEAGRFAHLFEGVVEQYKAQQQYDAA